MKVAILLMFAVFLLTASGCLSGVGKSSAPGTPIEMEQNGPIRRWRDYEMGVTCWTYHVGSVGIAMSCLSDKSTLRP